jgi:hypothetical protein
MRNTNIGEASHEQTHQDTTNEIYDRTAATSLVVLVYSAEETTHK